MLAHLADSESVELTTASQFLADHPPEDVMRVPESSWGSGGGPLDLGQPPRRTGYGSPSTGPRRAWKRW